MTAAFVSMSIFGILMLLILMIGSFTEIKNKSKKSLYFVYFSLADILALAVGIISSLVDNRPDLPEIITVFNYFDFVLSMWTVLGFVLYINICLEERKAGSVWYGRLALIYAIVASIVLLFMTITGMLFNTNTGYYQDGDFYFLGEIISSIPMFYVILLTLVNIKKFGMHDTVALIFFLLTPILFLIFEFYFPPFSFSNIAAALCALILFILFQSKEINSSQIREEILNEYARKDLLTGFLGRRAYDEDYEAKFFRNNGGVLFCDLNRLKYTNDNYGHHAGDVLIKDFADLLRKHFSEYKIFRVAGDEFIVIMSDILQPLFEEKVQAFLEDVRAKGQIASVGYEYGDLSEIRDVINEAELKMFEQKRDFHKKNPIYGRLDI